MKRQDPYHKLCSDCGSVFIGYNRRQRCDACRSSYNKRLAEAAHQRTSARRETKALIRRGALVRQPCEVCGEVKVHTHHEDYSRPADVRWLCSLCHSWWHHRVLDDISIDQWIAEEHKRSVEIRVNRIANRIQLELLRAEAAP